MTDFDGIVPAIAEALRKRGYSTLTPVQEAMIDPDLADRDVLVSAQTGSGKTVAFGLALAPNLLEDDGRFGRAATPLALAIAPTRELAMQVKRELEWLYEMTGASLATCVGGMDVRTERRALERGAHIVVGTPGRLRDHITRGALDLTDLRAVVLDEADEMLDLGFREDLEFILEASPDDRRTLMFSATVPRSIADLAKTYQRDARRVETVSEKKQHVDIDYRALTVANPDRENAIINVLRYYEAKNAIVFCSTRAAVNHLTSRLHNRGFSVVALSGELTQNERTHALQAMRDGRARVCIATDVAARGIDLPGLELVIHADLPTNSETLLHRSGRTGRAGNKGVSALIVPMSARRKAERLLMGASVKPTWALPPSADEVIERDNERLLVDPALADAVSEDEAPVVASLLEAHGAEKLAAAFLRLQRGNRSAPEDLIPVSLEPQRKRREGEDFPVTPSRSRDADFGPGRWFSLAVGRNQRAEPRWLIPMLCRHGNMTKREIGRIKLMQEETFVEIAEEAADNFLASLGPNKTIDRGINVRPVDGMPDFSGSSRDESPRPPRERSERPRKDRDDFRAKPPRKDWKSDKGAADGFASKKNFTGNHRADNDLRKADDEVWGDPKPATEKPFRKNDDSAPWKKAKPAGGKSAFAGRDNGDKRGDRPAYAGKPKGGPGGKGKPGGKSFGGKPFKGKKKG